MVPRLRLLSPILGIASILLVASPARAADGEAEGFQQYLPFVVGGVFAILVIGGAVLFQIAKAGQATTPSDSIEARINAAVPSSGVPIEKLAIPVLLVIGVGIGVWCTWDAFGQGANLPKAAYQNIQSEIQQNQPVIPQPNYLQIVPPQQLVMPTVTFQPPVANQTPNVSPAPSPVVREAVVIPNR